MSPVLVWRTPLRHWLTILMPLWMWLGCNNATVPGADGPALPSDTATTTTTEDTSSTRDTSTQSPPTVPEASPQERDTVASPGSVTFTEVHYHPHAADTEWLELHNPMALDMDLSGWTLEGGVHYAFAEGTVLPAGGYRVVAADPALLADAGITAALGPFEGRLANGGEWVELRSRSGRRIDGLSYGDDDPWPVHPDGSGFSLAKRSPTAASDRAEHWTVSMQPGGTPGAANGLAPNAMPITTVLVAEDAWWSYDIGGTYPSVDWAWPDHDDSAWDGGVGPFYAGDAAANVDAVAWATADNYYALYLGRANGGALRRVGEDLDGSWTSVEGFELVVRPDDHLYIAAWEPTGDSASPQMTIAEVELPEGVVGTDAATFEWVLGPSGANPGELPIATPPIESALATVIADANVAGTWEPPGVDAERGTSPWGSTVSGWFTDAARYVWGDTFDNNSVTNVDDTYALFRSVDPLLGPGDTLDVDPIPVTTLFRTGFTFEGDPSSTALYLDCVVDDGAVFYLNGVEVLRHHMPGGAVAAGTRASTEAIEPADLSAALPTGELIYGDNVLAVEVHQIAEDDVDMAFGCTLTAESWAPSDALTVVLNEVPPDGAWVELSNVSPQPYNTGGWVLASSAGDEVVLPAGALDPGTLGLYDDLGLSVEPGDRLFLYADDGGLLDAVRVQAWTRGRADEGGPWRVVAEDTPGAPNAIDHHDTIVIHEIQYHRTPPEGVAIAPRAEEWIELYNRGDESVDLGGWQLTDAVAFVFPPGTSLAPGAFLVVAGDAGTLRDAHPGITVVGDFEGRLDNGGDRILLLDGSGNPADEVRYSDGGRWPALADGGGSTLELRDPWADNAVPEAWAASDESARVGWTWVSYRGQAESSVVGPDGAWEELVVGLLDAGEVLVDDLSVVRDPDGAAVEILRNGSFDLDEDHWRLLGTHRHSRVVSDPDDPSNPVLRLTATGPTGHMHNHAETTLLEPIGSGEYEVSFRARWVAGANLLHSRLYFHRLPRTTRLPQPQTSGTPGAPNTAEVDNLGPTYGELAQDVAVPEAGEPVRVTVTAADPDGIAAVILWAAADGAPFDPYAMTLAGKDLWQAELPGHAAGTVVQLYAEAEDDLGARSTFPAAGSDSRALYIVDDGLAATNGLHNFRILMTETDADWLHDEVNLMSNDLVGATVVYDESEVFYDVGVKLKGSQRGRPTEARLGYGVRFDDDRPFRGSHTSVFIDRSEGVGFGQREVLMNLVMTRAGSVSGEHNDLIQLLAPRPEYSSSAELQLDRFSSLVLDAQFDDGASGARFEYELIYYPSTTDDGTAEGLKLPQPDSVIGSAITDLGEDPEAYRWVFLAKNNLEEDDYSAIVDMCQTFGLGDADFFAEVDAVIDVDQWLRAFAFATLSGATDQYASGAQHNAQFYVRPEDGRVLYFPHDLDYFSSSSMAVVGTADLARLLQEPAYLRSYYGHLEDIIATVYNGEALAPWCDQLSTLLPAQNFDAHCAFVEDRAAWVSSQASDSVLARFPPLEFRITTGGGSAITVSKPVAVLEGDAWVDVRTIAVDGGEDTLPITWLDDHTWQVTVAVAEGTHEVTLLAADLGGRVAGTDTIVVTYEPGG